VTNPKAMAKLEAELDEAGLLKTEANPRPREMTYADISKLHYLDCVIKVSCPPARCPAPARLPLIHATKQSILHIQLRPAVTEVSWRHLHSRTWQL
jgi:hypothetical protein